MTHKYKAKFYTTSKYVVTFESEEELDMDEMYDKAVEVWNNGESELLDEQVDDFHVEELEEKTK